MVDTKKKPIEVDYETCRALAELLRSREIPIDQEDSSLPGLSREQIGSYYFFLVAICHQTSPRGLPPLEGMIDGKKLRGWDFLTAKFESAVRLDSQLLDVDRWALMTSAELSELFRDSTFGERLSNPDGRAWLVRDLGQKMSQRGWATPQDIFHLCGGRVASGEPNLIEKLRGFKAYDDPIKKKSFFFLSLMRNCRIWSYPDNNLLGPPVDYHEVRGHLRIGTVTVRDEALRRKLFDSIAVTSEEDQAIRGAVFDAIMLLSELTGLHNPSQLHYLFWNVFRACCKHDETHCHGCSSGCALPQRYVPLALHDIGPRRCPFSGACRSVNRSDKLFEHVFQTEYY